MEADGAGACSIAATRAAMSDDEVGGMLVAAEVGVLRPPADDRDGRLGKQATIALPTLFACFACDVHVRAYLSVSKRARQDRGSRPIFLESRHPQG